MNNLTKEVYIPGTIYYNKEDKSGYYRLLKVEDDKVYLVTDDSNKIIMTLDNLNDLNKLSPNGIIGFNILQMDELYNGDNNTKDVIVYLVKSNDDELFPKVVCRQKILTDDIDNKPHLGDSFIRVNSYDEDYVSLFNCVDMLKSDYIAFYIKDLNDNLNTLLSFIDTEDYDDVLRKMKIAMCDNYTGLHGSLKEMITSIGFIDDLYKVYNIGICETKFEYNEIPRDDIYKISNGIYMELLDKLIIPSTHHVDDYIIIEYDYDINFDRIEKEYFLFKCPNTNILVMIYSKNGELFEL